MLHIVVLDARTSVLETGLASVCQLIHSRFDAFQKARADQNAALHEDLKLLVHVSEQILHLLAFATDVGERGLIEPFCRTRCCLRKNGCKDVANGLAVLLTPFQCLFCTAPCLFVGCIGSVLSLSGLQKFLDRWQLICYLSELAFQILLILHGAVDVDGGSDECDGARDQAVDSRSFANACHAGQMFGSGKLISVQETDDV